MSKRIWETQYWILRPAVNSFWYDVKNSCWLHKSTWKRVGQTCRHLHSAEWKSSVEVECLLHCFLMGQLISCLITQLAESGRDVVMSTFPVTADEIVFMAFTFPHEEAPGGGWLGEQKASLGCQGKELVSSEPLHELEAPSVLSSLNATSPWKLQLWWGGCSFPSITFSLAAGVFHCSSHQHTTDVFMSLGVLWWGYPLVLKGYCGSFHWMWSWNKIMFQGADT